MHQWTGSALLKEMACRLFGAKPLPHPMLTHCQLDPLKQTSVKFESKYKTFDWWKCIWISSVKWRPFCPGGDDITLQGVAERLSLWDNLVYFRKVVMTMVLSKITFLSKDHVWTHIVHTALKACLASCWHYNDFIMGAIASQITSLTIVYSTVNSDTDQRKHQNSASLAFVRGIHRGPVNSPRKWPVTRKMFPFDDVIMILSNPWTMVVVGNLMGSFFASDALPVGCKRYQENMT